MLRHGEMAALTFSDWEPEHERLGRLNVFKTYNHKKRVIKETKTRVPRYVPVHPALGRLLAEWRLAGFERFTGRRPRPEDLILPALTIEQLREHARSKRLASAPAPHVAHELRQQGLSFKEVGERLGCSEATAYRAFRRFAEPTFRANEPVPGIYAKPGFERRHGVYRDPGSELAWFRDTAKR
jgi:AraC-like DNA-binding protein